MKKAVAIAIVLLIVLVGYLYLTHAPTVQKPEGLNNIDARIVIKYEDGREETINPSSPVFSVLLWQHSVFYGGSKISYIYTFWDITSTVGSETGTVDYHYTVWVQGSASTTKMHPVTSTDIGKPLGTKYTLGYSSWVDATTIQSTLGIGTFTLNFYLDLSATAKTTGATPDTYTGTKTAYVSTQVTVQQGTLTITAVAQGIGYT